MHPHASPHPGGYTWADKDAPMMPLRLKKVLIDHGIQLAELASAVTNRRGKPLSRPTISQVCNRGLLPLATCPDFREQVEDFLRGRGVPETEIATIWEMLPKGEVVPFRNLKAKLSDKLPDNPISEILKEAEMLTPTTMKHFKLFRNPFLDDVREDRDVFMSQSHRYAHAAMMDAARNGGFVAVVGECGAGKSVMRRKLIHDLKQEDNIMLIRPRQHDGGRISCHSLLEAIIEELAPDVTPKRSREGRARQAERLLLAGAGAGMRYALVLEEAHDLHLHTLKLLKRLWEIEDGYRKVLGIVLVGQPELTDKLNLRNHPEIREVILRCLIATLDPLGRDECAGYIRLKFERVGARMEDILADGVVDAVMARLTTRQGWSAVYPLYINNLLAKAMNQAAQIGEPRVTAEIVESVR